MRISTSQIYDAGIRGMQRSQSAVYKTQNQIAADTRILRPSDDPVASAQVVVASQTKAINEQYQTNQKSATGQLALLDSGLSAVTTVLQKVRDNLVKGSNNAVLTDSDRQTIATDLEANFTELLGLANSTDQLGDYMYSGYQGSTRPFALDGSGGVVYSGDEGERLAQISASRQVAVNASGYDVFMDSETGNGSFVAATGGVVDSSGADVLGPDGKQINNQGAATIDTGSVTSPLKWKAAASDSSNPLPLKITFSTNATSGALEYSISDNAGNVTAAQTYTSGQAIILDTSSSGGLDFGAQVVITGTPFASTAAPLVGDTFEIGASTTQSVFQTIQNAITALRTGVNTTKDPVGNPASYTSTELISDLAAELTNIDLAMANVSEVQSTVGASAKEVDALASTSADLAVEYASILSGLRDLDYVEAYSTYTKQQVTLEAAQKSFTAISGKSLFDYM